MQPLGQIPQVPKKQQQKHRKEAIAPLPTLCERLGCIHNQMFLGECRGGVGLALAGGQSWCG